MSSTLHVFVKLKLLNVEPATKICITAKLKL